MPDDPAMPRQMPTAVERALRYVLAWRNRSHPVDVYATIHDVLAEEQAGGEAQVPGGRSSTD